jgi:hypothetical protein
MPADFALNKRQNNLKWAMVKEIESLGTKPRCLVALLAGGVLLQEPAGALLRSTE